MHTHTHTQEKEVRIREKMNSFKRGMEDKWESVEEKSKDLIQGFIGLFGRDGRIVSNCF